jgi:hypothetical protein
MSVINDKKEKLKHRFCFHAQITVKKYFSSKVNY